MENDLVKFSREGDTFHYRWAARRCLNLIRPRTPLKYIIIEGSHERKLAGEYVIDFSEYSHDSNHGEKIHYYQLKHSTKRKNKSFTLSELKETIEGFSKRFVDIDATGVERLKFSIITNRRISDEFKKGIEDIASGRTPTKRFRATLEQYTNLGAVDLQRFCTTLELVDGEGDYNVQRYELHAEIAMLVSGCVDNAQVDTIVALVSDPDNWHRKIYPEDILKRFGCTSSQELFPAPPEYDELINAIKREQHECLVQEVLVASVPVIIHASGGVGKSVFSHQLADSLPPGSLGIVYDCFGSGKYRNRSEPRHRYRDALVQISNEIASYGLSEPIIPTANALDDGLLRAFQSRLRAAAKALQSVNSNAVLAIVIDAADNAEMAAKEFNEPCFVQHLLAEDVPEGCKIIALCRTERVNLLRPRSSVVQLKLKNFSESETLQHLQGFFPQATIADGLEFHRLTGGNPRVQANELTKNRNNIGEIFTSLGPAGATVDDQISKQLASAIADIKEKLPSDFQKRVDVICLGLANLPPLIPLEVLATAANVESVEVKSFVADLGRPLWLSDNSVQFRDEPTETWFRQKFSASVSQIQSFVTHLKPLASNFPYVAEALPSLLLLAEQYDELIALALTDDFLPDHSPIDKRNIRVYRLQFAFKAALKKKRYADAAKLAFRAGEEVAGDNRQLELLKDNVDLISPLLSEQRVQELAFRRMLQGTWDGSENAYSAALLSSVNDYKGEARGFLRSALNWLRIFYEEQIKRKDHYHENVENKDVVQFAFAHLNLFGPHELVEFLLRWRSPERIFSVTRLLIRSLIDAGNFDAVNDISIHGQKNQYLIFAVTDELLAVGHFPPINVLRNVIKLMLNKETRIPKPDGPLYENEILSSIVSFAEACGANHISKQHISAILKYYIPKYATNMITYDNDDKERRTLLRTFALTAVLNRNFDPDIELLKHKEKQKDKKGYQKEEDERNFTEIVGGLAPWYILRARFLTGDTNEFETAFESADKRSKVARDRRYRQYDRIPYEISRIQFESFTLGKFSEPSTIVRFLGSIIHEDNKFWLSDRLSALRASYRLEHLKAIREKLERHCHDMVSSAHDDGPETKAKWYTDLSRAVLPLSRADAAAYFDYAVEAVSKFGDEIVERWNAVVSMAERSSEGGQSGPHIAYRFIRCAELIGENVAREKYFHRNWAVRISARLCPSSAFAALSRWRDRDIGWLDRQLPALAHELVSSNVISPIVCWSLCTFSWEDTPEDFAALCINKETNQSRRQFILDSAVNLLCLRDASKKAWETIENVATQFSLHNDELKKMISFHNEGLSRDEIKNVIEQPNKSRAFVDRNPADWSLFFGDEQLTDPVNLSKAISQFNEIAPRNPEEFWTEAYKRINDGDALSMLDCIASAECADFYDVLAALKCFPKQWRQKPSVIRGWPQIILKIAHRHCLSFANYHSLDYFVEQLSLGDKTSNLIKQGVIEGLADYGHFATAENYFGFMNIVAPFISTEEATHLLDYGIERFELHIQDDFGDGPWDKWLIPPFDTTTSFTGFVWSALGSPRAPKRWEAAHCVRMLAESGCEKEIKELISWMIKDSVDAFSHNKFPFYNLHARQYLLLSLARVAIDNPSILKPYSYVFSDIALNNMHVLIQQFASDIVTSIESTFPGAYPEEIMLSVSHVGKSQFPVRTIDDYAQKFDTPWHSKGDINNQKLHFCFDFDRYWFEPLGEVFGITQKQVEDLARQVVFEDWSLKFDSEFIRDPRQKLWTRGYEGQETSHSHSGYPRTDDYSFYVSYHAMLVVAAKLLKCMPIIHRRDWCEDEWNDWLDRHTLTSTDGRWLADRRDPAPLERRAWITEQRYNNWGNPLADEDFLDGLLLSRYGETWLNVGGYWTDSEREYEETYYVSTALVTRETSQSLLNALGTCKNSHNYKLPDYLEDRFELTKAPFQLTGWLHKESNDRRVGEFDPHACKISFPPFNIGNEFVDTLGVSPDSEYREWRLPHALTPSLINEIWSTYHNEEREEAPRAGNRIIASVGFLKKLCSDLDKELVFKVQIERRQRRHYYSGSDHDTGYKPPAARVYILTSQGILKGQEAHYHLR